jgi:hypothetical protein
VKLIVAFAVAVAAAIVVTPASADSLAFIRDKNVWLANADGSGQYQVTLDGTAAAPYESPSQSDGGTVVAVRAAPGQRRQIYRMTQSGALLNAPINTPAPGTGAIDAKLSPDGALVAYWFVTTVNDPICAFCVQAANQALLSHSDRFTGASEVGTPNTGGWPSWVTNSTITLGSGSATQWYYTLGMPEAAEWFNDSDVTGGIVTLLDAEAAPTGDRLAVVRGDNQETILLLRMNGPPPAKPSIANAMCDAFAGPSGKFVDPTWSSDGRQLAWQENDGVHVAAIPADLADCAGFGASALRIPSATHPDFSPAAIAPGPRPPCGNPGGPVACATNAPSGGATLRQQLTALLTAQAKALRKLGIRGLRRKGKFKVAFQAPGAGTLAVKLTAKRSGIAAARTITLASGRLAFKAAGTRTVTVKLTRAGRSALRRARRAKTTLQLSFTPKGAKATTVKLAVQLRR